MAALALTGTPGTGKSSVARVLGRTVRVLEVGELAGRLGTGERGRGGWVVDLPRTAEEWRARRDPPADLIVGHLAHLLPIRDVVVLRCHPRQLSGRLGRSRRNTGAERRENLVAEVTDAILIEAVGLRRRVWEVDTTRRDPRSVAREVLFRFRRRGPPSYGGVDWLSDPWVSEHLLDWAP